MTKRFKKLKDNFKVKIVPSIIVTVCAIVLISGAHYLYAAWDTPAKSSGNTLLSADWNALVIYVKTMKTDISTLQTSMTTLSNRITTLENKAAAWPTGSYCIIMALGAGSCPSGFNAVNPRRAPAGNLGAESGFIAGGNTSSLANTAVTWGMANTDPVNYQVWAWCCK
jgi:hypothetical protein